MSHVSPAFRFATASGPNGQSQQAVQWLLKRNCSVTPAQLAWLYLSLCAVSNHIRRFKRPDYIAHRDFTPIRCLPDDCLLKDYEVALPWKDRILEPLREAS